MQFCHQLQTNSSTSYIVELNLNLNIEMWLDFPGKFILMKKLPVLAASMDLFTSSLTSLLTNSTAIRTSANMSAWTHEVIGKKAIGFCCRTGVSLGQTATEEERERRKGRERGWGSGKADIPSELAVTKVKQQDRSNNHNTGNSRSHQHPCMVLAFCGRFNPGRHHHHHHHHYNHTPHSFLWRSSSSIYKL